MPGRDNTNKENQYSFPQKVWIVGGIFAFIVIMLLLLKATFNVLLLVLAGILIAVFFRGLSGLLQKTTGWKEGICVAVAVIGTIIILILFFWLIGSKVQSQAEQLSDALPSTIENAKKQLNKSAVGKKIVEKISSPETQKKASAMGQTFFKSTFGVLADLYVVLFLGIFFTVSPDLYKKGMVRLVPKKGERKANDVLTKTADNLRKWLKGKLFAMLVVFILTAIGLLIIGVPMWLVLALIAGLLSFIPNFGPLIAIIPAILVGLMQDTTTAIWIAGLYILIQVVESNFIAPMVQQRLISLPPAMIIIAQLFIAPLTGGWGLVLATPLMVILMVIVKELYIKNQEANE